MVYTRMHTHTCGRKKSFVHTRVVFRNTELLLSQCRSRDGCAEATSVRARLRALAADAARELDVLGLDRHALRVDRAEVRVLEEADEVRLRRLLQREHRGALEAQVRLELLRDLAHEALEGELAHVDFW